MFSSPQGSHNDSFSSASFHNQRLPLGNQKWESPRLIAFGCEQLCAVKSLMISQYNRSNDGDYLMHGLARMTSWASASSAVRELIVQILDGCQIKVSLSPRLDSFCNISRAFLAAGDPIRARKLVTGAKSLAKDSEVLDYLHKLGSEIHKYQETGEAPQFEVNLPLQPGWPTYRHIATDIIGKIEKGGGHEVVHDEVLKLSTAEWDQCEVPPEVVGVASHLVMCGEPELGELFIESAMGRMERKGTPFAPQCLCRGYCDSLLPEKAKQFLEGGAGDGNTDLTQCNSLPFVAALIGSRLPDFLSPVLIERARSGDTSDALVKSFGFLVDAASSDTALSFRNGLSRDQRFVFDLALVKARPEGYEQLAYYAFSQAREVLTQELGAPGTHASHSVKNAIQIIAALDNDTAAKDLARIVTGSIIKGAPRERLIISEHLWELHRAYLMHGTRGAIRGEVYLTLGVLDAQLLAADLSTRLVESLNQRGYGRACYEAAEVFFKYNSAIRLPGNLTRAYLAALTSDKPCTKSKKILGDAARRYFSAGIEHQPELIPLYCRVLIAHGTSEVKREMLKAARRYFDAEDFNDGVQLRAYCKVTSQLGTVPDKQRLLSIAKKEYTDTGIDSPLLRRIVSAFQGSTGGGAFAVNLIDLQDLPPDAPIGEHFVQLHQNERGRDLQARRENEFMMRLVLDGRTPQRIATGILAKLARNGFIDESIPAWIQASNQKEEQEEYARRRAVFSAVLDMGIIPSVAMLEAVLEAGKTYEVRSYLEKLKARYADFITPTTLQDRLRTLTHDPESLLAYYVAYFHRTHFDLITNYPLERFQEIVHLAEQRKVSDVVLNQFEAALVRGGLRGEAARQIIVKLKDGHAPVHGEAGEELVRELRLDISNNALLESANREISAALGSFQLGSIIRSALYRSYLNEVSGSESLSQALTGATTFESRRTVLSQLEKQYPDFLPRAIEQIKVPWEDLAPLLSIDYSVSDFLTGNPKVSAESVYGGIEQRRRSLRVSKSAVLQALKGSNPQLVSTSREIARKERALQSLETGIEKDASLQERLGEQISNLRAEIRNLRTRTAEIAAFPVINRYSELNPDEKKRRIESEQQQFKALTEKDPASLLTYLIASIIDEDLYLEADAELLKEVASHLQSPLDTVRSLAHLDEAKGARPTPRLARIRYLDKVRDLLTIARFADSKVCCYSSNNYEMIVAHERPNKEFLAARIADPLSFVWAIEEDVDDEGSSAATRNLGFVMGEYGLTEEGLPTVNLNGIYLVTGNEQRAAEAVLNGIEELVARPLRAKALIVGATYGGALTEAPQGYQVGAYDVIRLRALTRDDDIDKQNYDDLGTIMNSLVRIGNFYKQL